MRIEVNMSFTWFNHLFSKHLFSWVGIVFGAVCMLMNKSGDSYPVSPWEFLIHEGRKKL